MKKKSTKHHAIVTGVRNESAKAYHELRGAGLNHAARALAGVTDVATRVANHTPEWTHAGGGLAALERPFFSKRKGKR